MKENLCSFTVWVRNDRFPLGVRGEEILVGGGRGEGEERVRKRALILLSPNFAFLISFPPEKPDTQANSELTISLSYWTNDGVLWGDFKLCLWMKSYGVTIQMKPLQQYFHRVLFIKHAVLTFGSVDEILWSYHSNETSSAVLSHGSTHLVCTGSSNFWVCGRNRIVWPFEWNLFRSTLTWHHLSFRIVQNEISKFSWILTLATLGCESG